LDMSFVQILFLLFLAYAVAPTALIRFGRVGAFSRAPKGEGRVALTFDEARTPSIRRRSWKS
jgi:hypothetical protein